MVLNLGRTVSENEFSGDIVLKINAFL